jgi:phosphoenolpyruvate carboxykinase (ATP)
MVKRGDIAYTDRDIDLERTDYVIFINRRYDILPPVVRLNDEWGAAAFMLGESVETSAGDPSEAGKSKRVVGTNPFIVGSEVDEGNIFLKILRTNPEIQCYILNTGQVGGRSTGQKITVQDTVRIMEMIARDKIVWRKDDFWGYDVPLEIPGLDLSRFDLNKFYPDEEIQDLSETLKRERVEWLSKFKGLDPDILEALRP